MHLAHSLAEDSSLGTKREGSHWLMHLQGGAAGDVGRGKPAAERPSCRCTGEAQNEEKGRL
jgi:hypothetical protein